MLLSVLIYTVISLSPFSRKAFTPFRIFDAQSASPSPLITARKSGVLNEKSFQTMRKQTHISPIKMQFRLFINLYHKQFKNKLK